MEVLSVWDRATSMLNQGTSSGAAACRWVCSTFRTSRDLSSERREPVRFLSWIAVVFGALCTKGSVSVPSVLKGP